MKFIDGIKTNYYRNLINNSLKENNHSEIFDLFNQLSANTDLKNQIAFEYLEQINDIDGSDIIFNKNLFWLNSFQIKDLDIIKNFLTFYIKKLNLTNFLIDDYCTFLDSSDVQKFTTQLTFESFQEFPTFLQFLISNPKKNFNKFISSPAAFFETAKKKFFINHRLTAGYIYLIKNPLLVYSDLVQQYQDHEVALNFLLNLDQRPRVFEGNIIIHETACDWATNALSWYDDNVRETYRGLTIKFEDLIANPIETLSGIIFHLNSSGFNLELNYGIIDSYIKENSIAFSQKVPVDISNKIKKRMGHVIDTAIKLGYEI